MDTLPQIPDRTAFFREPHTVFVWGEERAAVHRIVRRVAETFSPTFLRIRLLDPNGPSGADTAFEDVPSDRTLELPTPSDFLPDPAAGNLSAFIDGGTDAPAADRLDTLLFPPPLRAFLANHAESNRLAAVVVTDVDRMGTISPEMIRVLARADQRLKELGTALVVGHCGDQRPPGDLALAFDCILHVRAVLDSPGSTGVMADGGSQGGLLPAGQTMLWSELDRALNALPPPGGS